MSFPAQSIAIVGALVGSYVWLRINTLHPFTAQLAAGLVLVYFLIRLARKKHLLMLTEERSSPEFALFSACVFLLIGSTGNLHSLFFPLAYLHIFFLTMSVRPLQAVVLGIAVILFHYSLQGSIDLPTISTLSSLLLMLLVFLFAKNQYDDRVEKEQVVEAQEEEISEQQSNAVLFVSTFLKPKLETLLKLADYPEENKEVIIKQIILIKEEVEKLVDSEATGFRP